MGWCHRARRERDFWSRGNHGEVGGVDQEAGKQERAKMSEWTWDDLAVWSNLLLCADGVAKTLSVFILALGIAITSGTISKKSLLF